MAVSVVSICNAALRLVNVATINDENESSEQARACNALFDTARDAILRAFVWNFARAFATLGPLASLTHPDWSYIYALPANCLYAVRVFPSEKETLRPDPRLLYPGPADERFEMAFMEGSQVVMTNVEKAMMEYVYRVTDPTVFDPCFVEALEYKLASLLAVPMTGNSQVAQYYASMANAAIVHASTLSAQEGRRMPLKRPVTSRFEVSRR